MVAGYCERESEAQDSKLYNSCYVLNRKGELELNYRKSILYDTDVPYFSPGDGIKHFEITTSNQ